ncbi:GIY-YIG nuclease family protein [Deinococcus arboris]
MVYAATVSGYVYVLSNESLPGVMKVGMTSRDPFTRAAELTTTGLPMPFRVEFCLMTERPAALELALHQQFAAQRVQAGREFFRVSRRHAPWLTGRPDHRGTCRSLSPIAPLLPSSTPWCARV